MLVLYRSFDTGKFHRSELRRVVDIDQNILNSVVDKVEAVYDKQTQKNLILFSDVMGIIITTILLIITVYAYLDPGDIENSSILKLLEDEKKEGKSYNFKTLLENPPIWLQNYHSGSALKNDTNNDQSNNTNTTDSDNRNVNTTHYNNSYRARINSFIEDILELKVDMESISSDSSFGFNPENLTTIIDNEISSYVEVVLNNMGNERVISRWFIITIVFIIFQYLGRWYMIKNLQMENFKMISGVLNVENETIFGPKKAWWSVNETGEALKLNKFIEYEELVNYSEKLKTKLVKPARIETSKKNQ